MATDLSNAPSGTVTRPAASRWQRAGLFLTSRRFVAVASLGAVAATMGIVYVSSQRNGSKRPAAVEDRRPLLA